MAGPAANAASILVINKVLGRKTLLVYLISISLGAIGFGLGIDYLLPAEWFTPTLAKAADCCDNHVEWFNIGCTIVLGLLLIYALIDHLRGHHHHGEETCEISTDNARRFAIKGMNCSHCAKNAENAIRKVEGIESVSVDLASETATIVGTASDEEIIQAVEALGFEGVKE
jgi:copper chaperone CopZ